MTLRKLIPITAALAAASLAATACGGSAEPVAEGGSGTGPITVWASQGQEKEAAALQDIVTRFNTGQTAVKAQLRLIPEADYPKAIAATQAKALPDVLMVDGPTATNLVYDQKLTALDPFVSAKVRANATEAIKAQGTIGGKLYVLGQFEAGLGIWGNKKLLQAAGVKYPTGLADAWTAPQFTQALTALAAKDDDGKVLDIKENYPVFNGEWGTFGFSPILYSAGAALIRNGKASGALDSPQAVGAMKTFASWKRYVDANTKDDAFTKGKVALSWVGHWTYPDYDKALSKDLVLLPLPDFGNGVKSGHGSWAWGISATSKNAKAAGAFLDHLLGDGPVTQMTTANGAIPGTRTALAASKLYKPGGPLALYSAQLDKPCGDNADRSCAVVTRPLTAGYPVVSKQFAAALNEIYKGADPQAQLTKAAKAIDTDFADNDGYVLR
ncbi:type 2 periplasmic-binding domain-containing protein [Actinomadura rudentiformis]|uniref:Extracellular solute-binding protein n=1 Tax=Actinomadura rudentiformis TaxID=359158 RepID=A0A6H9Z2Z8_9ACTN|nr:extracellular solute-binding protein [Actinomadura rudentiformis]KAB2350093.1 extracellular solute-binding protein [Actinomadura rudentiformis]